MSGGGPIAGADPPIRRGLRRGIAKLWLAVAAALLVSAAVVVVAWNLAGPGPSAGGRGVPSAIADGVAPAPLTGEERTGRLDRLDEASVALAEGGWVQVADERGRLAQEYSASRMDPLPQRWMRMEQPRARIFASDGRVITLAGREGRVRIPERAIESGTLTGEVVIEIHAATPDGRLPAADAVPEVVIRADEAVFDQLEGRIRCDRRIELESPGVFFEGEGLLLLLDSSGRGFERLSVERATGPIRLQPALLRGDAGADDAPRPAPAAAGSSEGTPSAAAGEGMGKGTGEATPSAATAGTGAAAGEGTPSEEPAAKPAVPPFRKLILEDEVVVTRTLGGDRTVITGDRLEAVFSLEDGSLGSLAAASPPTPVLGERAWLAAAILAGPLQSPEAASSAAVPEADELVEIAFAGMLELVPVGAGEELPDSPEEVLLRIVGEEVRIADEASSAMLRCESLAYRSISERLRLDAPRSGVRIEAKEFTLAAPSLAADLLLGEVALPGPGTLELDASASAPDAAGSEPLRIAWSQSLDLTLRSEDRGLRFARFGGEVAVVAETLAVAADRMDVSFRERAADASRDRIDWIEAIGAARAQRRGEASGRLDAERIRIEFAAGDPSAGDSGEAAARDRPSRLLAEGGVRAVDETAILWAERVDVELAAAAAAAGDAAASVAATTAEVGGEAAIRRVLVESPAGGTAIVGLADGAWIHASRVDADREAGIVRFAGPDLALLRDGAMLDRLESLELVEGRTERSARSGGGRLRSIEGNLVEFAWPQAPPLGEDLRVAAWAWPSPPPRPDPTDELAMLATWSESMRFTEAVPDPDRVSAAGEDARLDLAGGVQLRAWPVEADRLQEDRLEAREVEVHFLRREIDDRGGNAAAADAASPLERAGLEPVRLFAREDASLESRSARDAAAMPSLFRIAGPEIEYRLADGEGWVRGAGSLLVAEPAAEGRAAETSRFRWLGRLELLRPQADRAIVNLVDGVELMHADGSAAFSMTSQRMEITLATSPPEAGAAPAADPRRGEQEARLLRVQGLGRVLIRTAERDVECDRFDYDAESGLADASARRGRMVTVVSRGAAGPVRAEQVRWNLRTGSIDLVEVGGSLSP